MPKVALVARFKTKEGKAADSGERHRLVVRRY